MQSIKDFRLLATHRGKLHSLCKVAFTKRDHSFYFIPFGARGTYFYGTQNLPEKTFEHKFDFTRQLSSSHMPKLSIHESGQVHIKDPSGDCVAGPLRIPNLHSLRGEHICTLRADTLEDLPQYGRKTKRTGKSPDLVFTFPDEMMSGRVCFYLNGKEPSFAYRTSSTYAQLGPDSGGAVLYLGFVAKEDVPIGLDRPSRGCTIISGWDPSRSAHADQDFLYLRVE